MYKYYFASKSEPVFAVLPLSRGTHFLSVRNRVNTIKYMRFTCFIFILLNPLVVYLMNMNMNMISLKNRNFSFGLNKKKILGYTDKFP